MSDFFKEVPGEVVLPVMDFLSTAREIDLLRVENERLQIESYKLRHLLKAGVVYLGVTAKKSKAAADWVEEVKKILGDA